MKKNVYESIKADPDLHYFLRSHPRWYRQLGRDPESYNNMITEANRFYGKTFPQRVEKLQNNMNLAMMVIEMMRQVNENN